MRKTFTSHTVSTAYEQGWSTLKNGDLLKNAEEAFDLLIKTDKNLRHEQNLKGLKLSILMLPFASWPRLKHHLESISSKINEMKAGDYFEIDLK